MATTGSVQTIDYTQQIIQGKVQHRRKAWTQVHETFNGVERVIRLIESSARSQRGHTSLDVRKVIFEEQTKLIDLLTICMNLRDVRRKFQDVFTSLKTLTEFRTQTIDDLVQDLKLSDYTHLFRVSGNEYARQLLDIDLKATFEQQMKIAPFKRLQKKVDRINSVKEYVEHKLDGDISTAAKETRQDLEAFERRLVSSFGTINSLQSQPEGNIRNQHYLQSMDVLGLTFIGCSGLLAYWIYRPFISSVIVILTAVLFRNSIANAFRRFGQGNVNNQQMYTLVSVQTDVVDQWATSIKKWIDALISELNEWVQLMRSFQGHLLSSEGNTADISSQIGRTESQLEHFLEDADALESELKRLCSRN